ncbi:Gfo/Idh/MocA family oxidoreductase [Blastopirellula sp. JC732]|uniref:Gfo/Idh/MocA family oxidoreductase n=1 Tax=Blastopirellula sediminis TaxID=2894196 RepID=A0A9X1SFE5_9BACT|nr:Gfo/Idh/MocA family oxidoreductase [Blastopirellula sediminis]MCC9609010.1 Gfo/Idh/MocA family oxidoreductase [Blastopirellula sediminis]MCC9628213.1 Gfo/Idh/MocA family oxidoreductase [Blastopirellula sediminis]
MASRRLAVIGAGHLGKIHARLAKQTAGLELVAIVDPIAAAREAAAAENGVPAYASHREISGEFDAAIIATPTQYHFGVAAELLADGVDLLVEKPITLSITDADQLLALAKVHGRVLQVGHVERFNPAFVAAAELIDRPRYIEAARTSGYSFRSVDIGVTLDLMIHDIDLVLSLVGSSVVNVDAIGASVFGPHEDMVQARLTFENGCVANLTASRSSFQPRREMKVFHAGGFVQIDMGSRKLQSIQPDPRLAAGELDVHTLPQAEKDHIRQHLFESLLPLEEVELPPTNAIADEQADFVRAIETGSKPRVDGFAGRDAVIVAEMVAKCVERHVWHEAGRSLRGPHFTAMPQLAPQTREAA